jgi:hypothetical protein
MFYYGAFIFIYVYSFTELMDKNANAVIYEIAKCILGLAIIIYLGDWFGANKLSPIITIALATYFILSMGISIWIYFAEFKTQNTVEAIA